MFEISLLSNWLVFSCEGAAQHLHFSSVCLSLCPSQNWISPCFVHAWTLFDRCCCSQCCTLRCTLWCTLGMLRILELFSDHQWQSTWMSGGSDKPKKTKTALGTCFFASRLVVSGLEGEIQRKLSTKRKSLFSDSKLYLRRLKTSEMDSWLNSDTFRPP